MYPILDKTYLKKICTPLEVIVRFSKSYSPTYDLQNTWKGIPKPRNREVQPRFGGYSGAASGTASRFIRCQNHSPTICQGGVHRTLSKTGTTRHRARFTTKPNMKDHVYLSSQFENRLKQVMRRPILASNQHQLGGETTHDRLKWYQRAGE